MTAISFISEGEIRNRSIPAAGVDTDTLGGDRCPRKVISPHLNRKIILLQERFVVSSSDKVHRFSDSSWTFRRSGSVQISKKPLESSAVRILS